MADNETQQRWLALVSDHPQAGPPHRAAAEAMLIHGKRIPDEHAPAADELVAWGLAFKDGDGYTTNIPLR